MRNRSENVVHLYLSKRRISPKQHVPSERLNVQLDVTNPWPMYIASSTIEDRVQGVCPFSATGSVPRMGVTLNVTHKKQYVRWFVWRSVAIHLVIGKHAKYLTDRTPTAARNRWADSCE